MRAQLARSGRWAAILFVAASASFAADAADVPVKKSRAGVCHAQGTAGYEQTKRFQSFNSIEACLQSHGRLPKTPTRKKLNFDPSKPVHAGDEGVLYGPLVRVVDGDSLIVKIQGANLHIRLAGVDAPESDQPFGDNARKELVSLIGGQPCVMVYEEGDTYGRLVVHLWIGDTYVNAEMVKQGMAWFDSASAPSGLLISDEDDARNAKRGLWSLPLSERVPPWEWRHEKR